MPPADLSAFYDWTCTGVLFARVQAVMPISLPRQVDDDSEEASGVDDEDADDEAATAVSVPAPAPARAAGAKPAATVPAPSPAGGSATAQANASSGSASSRPVRAAALAAAAATAAGVRLDGSMRAAPRTPTCRGWHMLRLQLFPTLTRSHGAELDELDAEGNIVLPPTTAAPAAGAAEDGDESMSAGDIAAAERAALTIQLPWLPPTDPRVTEPFLVSYDAYAKSVQRDLKAGTQIRRMFMVRAMARARMCGCALLQWRIRARHTAQAPDRNTEGEWYEGRIYGRQTRREDREFGWTSCEYKCIRVVWVRARR